LALKAGNLSGLKHKREITTNIALPFRYRVRWAKASLWSPRDSKGYIEDAEVMRSLD